MLQVFPGVNILTNLSCLINDQLAFSAAFPWPSCYNTHFLCNNTRMLSHWPILTLGSRFTLLVDQNSKPLTTKPCYFNRTKRLTVSKVCKTKHHSKTQEYDVLEGDNVEAIQNFNLFSPVDVGRACEK